MRAHQQAFLDRGARLAAVGLGDRTYARIFREETGIAFPLLIGFVFGPGNVDRYAHISKTFGDNASPETLLAALL